MADGNARRTCVLGGPPRQRQDGRGLAGPLARGQVVAVSRRSTRAQPASRGPSKARAVGTRRGPQRAALVIARGHADGWPPGPHTAARCSKGDDLTPIEAARGRRWRGTPAGDGARRRGTGMGRRACVLGGPPRQRQDGRGLARPPARGFVVALSAVHSDKPASRGPSKARAVGTRRGPQRAALFIARGHADGWPPGPHPAARCPVGNELTPDQGHGLVGAVSRRSTRAQPASRGPSKARAVGTRRGPQRGFPGDRARTRRRVAARAAPAARCPVGDASRRGYSDSNRVRSWKRR